MQATQTDWFRFESTQTYNFDFLNFRGAVDKPVWLYLLVDALRVAGKLTGRSHVTVGLSVHRGGVAMVTEADAHFRSGATMIPTSCDGKDKIFN